MSRVRALLTNWSLVGSLFCYRHHDRTEEVVVYVPIDSGTRRRLAKIVFILYYLRKTIMMKNVHMIHHFCNEDRMVIDLIIQCTILICKENGLCTWVGYPLYSWLIRNLWIPWSLHQGIKSVLLINTFFFGW